jgi:hypothetical protein
MRTRRRLCLLIAPVVSLGSRRYGRDKHTWRREGNGSTDTLKKATREGRLGFGGGREGGEGREGGREGGKERGGERKLTA